MTATTNRCRVAWVALAVFMMCCLAQSAAAATVKNKPLPMADTGRIIRTAEKYKGVRYLYGGITDKGFDCSGYVQLVFKQNKVNLPRTADAQFKAGNPVGGDKPDIKLLKRGDLVFFNTDAAQKGIDHVGIYAGKLKFWNVELKKGVNEASLADDYWKRCYAGARRVVDNDEHSRGLLEYLLDLFS